MIKVSDLKEGDIIEVEYEGSRTRGEVLQVGHGHKMAKVLTHEAQENWYTEADMHACPLNDAALQDLHFNKQVNEDGTVKYMKGAFRMLLSRANDFDAFQIWYREDRRQIHGPLCLHQLQNHYLDMTKVHLTTAVI